MILSRLLTEVLFVFICIEVQCIVHPPVLTNELHHTKLNFQSFINKVILTQKGYIQFLKYYVEVKPISEYTFCIWINSHNLTYSHPLLSYSKHEEERLIRVWITPGGHKIQTEILGVPVFSVPINFVENQWYHVCQSWSSYRAAWNLFVDGRLFSEGYLPELQGRIIDGDGDIVVGQEYTDFDKGLDDGIEGAIYGFNFVLSPSFHSSDSEHLNYDFDNGLQLSYGREKRANSAYGVPPATRYGTPILPASPVKGDLKKPTFIKQNHEHEESKLNQYDARSYGIPVFGLTKPGKSHINFNTVPDHIFKVSGNESRNVLPRKYQRPDASDQRTYSLATFISDSKQHTPHLRRESFAPNQAVEDPRDEYVKRSTNRVSLKEKLLEFYGNIPVVSANDFVPSTISNTGHPELQKPLGLVLVELSFDCSFRKGAPLDGPKVLINWAKTPVRVFGGALLKSIPPFCK